ncbi:MAG: AAA family ATPase [Planctomycetia bacterium]|nr:AAA family ATPase [Planctomycetia bacterium]
MRIETIEVRNFRTFKSIKMTDIPKFSVMVGANGTGKTTLFQLFGFLKSAMKDNVRVALAQLGGSRGFDEVRTRNSEGPIVIILQFREENKSPLITYELAVNADANGPYVEKETLRYRRGVKGQPWYFLKFENGAGEAVTNELETITDEKDLIREKQSLKSREILAIKGLSQFEKFQAVRMLGDLIENWHISDFHVNKARDDSNAEYAEHLSVSGDNLSMVTEFLYKNHPDILERICKSIERRIPGIKNVAPVMNEEGKVLLKFHDKSFDYPFLARYVSDGTLKMFAYLILLNDPNPHPLLCIEEPENQLYPTLLCELAEEFRSYSHRGQQVFVSTHSPDFLNAVRLDEVFLLVKKDGYTTVQRASKNRQIKIMMEEGDKMGWLWKAGYFGEVDPS